MVCTIQCILYTVYKVFYTLYSVVLYYDTIYYTVHSVWCILCILCTKCAVTRYTILLTKTTASQNEVALSYHNVRGLYFLAFVFVGTIIYNMQSLFTAYIVYKYIHNSITHGINNLP